MPFVRLPGLVGKVYVAEKQPDHLKKHPCRHCYSCQRCGDDRCGICRNNACRTRDPLSGAGKRSSR